LPHKKLAEQVKAGQVKSGQNGQGRTGKGGAGQGRSRQGRAGQGRVHGDTLVLGAKTILLQSLVSDKELGNFITYAILFFVH